MIQIKKDDITAFRGDIIVNAANASLMGGGGVDGAIHKAAGPELLEECKKYIQQKGELSPGETALTKAGKLNCKYVVHTVGPQWRGGIDNEDQKLANCYINSLQNCILTESKSIAFPNISTGIYNYPKKDAAELAIATVSNFLNSIPDDPEVYFYCFDEENYRLYEEILQRENSILR